MTESLTARVEQTLLTVVNARTGTSVLASDQVRDVATSTAGRVQLTLLLGANDDPTLARDVRQAVEALDGVTDVRVNVVDAATDPRAQHGAAAAAPPRRSALRSP